MAADAKKDLLPTALEVKRGQVALAEVPEKDRAAVKKLLRSTPDSKFRALALDGYAAGRSVYARRGAQPHYRGKVV